MGKVSENFHRYKETIKNLIMKIGILTFHRAHNYGAMLQAYALSRLLSAYAQDVEFIDYRNPKIEEAYRIFSCNAYRNSSPIDRLKTFISRIITLSRRCIRYAKFRKFREKYLPESARYIQDDKFSSYYDILVFGSDQIWTTRFLKDFDPVFWGDIDVQCGKKIAYAPSMEMSSLSKEQQAFCKEHLNNFEFISVREDSMKELLSPLTKKDIEVVIDPVFLWDKKEYERLASYSKLKLPDHYILVYSIGSATVELNSVVNKIVRELKLPVYYLSSEVSMSISANRLQTAGPEDFLKAFRDADFIITTTFHGTAFSVIFYSLRKIGLSGRAESLLHKLGLEKALIVTEREASAISYPTVDYDEVKELVSALRKKAISYIEKAIK